MAAQTPEEKYEELERKYQRISEEKRQMEYQMWDIQNDAAMSLEIAGAYRIVFQDILRYNLKDELKALIEKKER